MVRIGKKPPSSEGGGTAEAVTEGAVTEGVFQLFRAALKFRLFSIVLKGTES